MLLPLKGIIPPMITSLKSNNELDKEGVVRLIEHMIGVGVHDLFLLRKLDTQDRKKVETLLFEFNTI